MHDKCGILNDVSFCLCWKGMSFSVFYVISLRIQFGVCLLWFSVSILGFVWVLICLVFG